MNKAHNIGRALLLVRAVVLRGMRSPAGGGVGADLTEADLEYAVQVAKSPQQYALLKDEIEQLNASLEVVHADAQILVKRKNFAFPKAFAAACLKHNMPTLGRLYAHAPTVLEFERQLQGVEVAAHKKGSEKTERSLLKPRWTTISKAARVLGIHRNTIADWYKEKTIYLPSGGTTRAYTLARNVLGQVNLTLLNHIVEEKRKLATPGRSLGGSGGRALVEVALKAKTNPAAALDNARVNKAFSLMARVASVSLLKAHRRQISRMIAKRKRS